MAELIEEEKSAWEAELSSAWLLRAQQQMGTESEPPPPQDIVPLLEVLTGRYSSNIYTFVLHFLHAVLNDGLLSALKT